MQDPLDGNSLPENNDDEIFELPYKVDTGDVDPETVTTFELSYVHYNKMWSDAQEQLGYILKKEPPLDVPSEIVYVRLPLVHRVSKMYLLYIDVTNKIIKSFENIAHPQKRVLLRKMVDTCIGRVLEIKNELFTLERSDFHFLDHLLLNLKMLPEDMDIKIPEHFRDRTDEENEHRKIFQNHSNVQSETKKKNYIVTEKEKLVKTAMVYIRLIQAHERTRQAREIFQEYQKFYIVKQLNKMRETRKEPNMTRQRAATSIQRSWRWYWLRKSLKQEYAEELDFLGMVPRSRKDLIMELEKDRLYIIKRNEMEYQKARETFRRFMILYKVPEMMEKLEDQIRSYFGNYLLLYGYYPDFPKEEEGGSTKMFETPVDIDPNAPPQTLEIVPEPKKDSKAQKEAQKAKEKAAKDAKAAKGKGEKKDEREGYSLKASKFLADLISLQKEYKTIWFEKELVNFDRHDNDMLKEDITKIIELEVRVTVDNKMRLELDKLSKALQKDSKKKKKKKGKKGKGKKGKGKKGKGRKKKGKDLTPDRTSESLIEELTSEGIIVSYPKYKLCDFVGDYNFTGSAQQLAGDPLKDPFPCLGDVRRVINEYCILPMGSEEMRPKVAFVKSLLIAGPKGVGKKSLIYAVCNELNATMMDLSAENIQGKYPGKDGKKMLLHLILKVGRLMQPTVIFIKDAENYFYKKKPPSCTLTEPTRLKKDLAKFVKGIKNDDRVMVCGTAVSPFTVDLKKLGKSYSRVICIFKPDYNCRRSIWREMIVRNKGVITKKLDMTVLCSVSDGFTAGTIETAVKKTLTDRRLALQKVVPVRAGDFFPELAHHTPVYEEENEAYKQWWMKMPIKKKRKKLLTMEAVEEMQYLDESEEDD